MLSRFAGFINAAAFAYGVNDSVGPLVVDIGSAAGAHALTLMLAYIVLSDGTKVNPLNTNAPITIGGGAAGTLETRAPTSVSAGSPEVYDSASITATWTYAHGKGEQVSSGTCGLQEALNYASSVGGGTVVVDAKWKQMGGTDGMIAAATVPTGTVIADNRSGGASLATQYASINIGNAAILTLNGTPVQIVPAQGAGTLIEILSITLEHIYASPTFQAGSTLQAYYAGGSVVATATIAANLLAGPTANTSATTPGTAVAVTTSSGLLNTAVNLHATSTEFSTGGGSLRVQARYVVHSGL